MASSGDCPTTLTFVLKVPTRITLVLVASIAIEERWVGLESMISEVQSGVCLVKFTLALKYPVAPWLSLAQELSPTINANQSRGAQDE